MLAGGAAGIAAGVGVSAFMNAVTTNSLGLTSGSIKAEGALSAPTVNGRDVALSWPADTLTDGTSTTYYVLRDSSGASGTCAGVLPSSSLSCTDTDVPPGAHTYTVVPTYLMWTGPSASVASPVVGTPSFGLSPASTTTLAKDAAGTVTNLVDNETVTFRLDDAGSGTILATSPSTVSTGSSGGGASPTVTIPAGIAGGAHTVYAVGNLGDQASTTFTVDVPPTLSFTNGTFSSLPGTLTGGAITYFRAGETVSFHLDSATGTTLTSSPASVSIGSNGQTGSAFAVTVPSGIADGTHTVYAVGGSGSQATYSIAVSVPSTFSITSAQNLTSVPGTITGGTVTYFNAGENLIIRLDSVSGTILSTSPSTVTTDGNGQASAFSATIPSGVADGTHTLVALGNTSGLSATSNSFTVNAPSTFSITSGQSLPASSLPAAVSGGAVASFNGAENVTIHLDTAGGTVLSTSPSPVTTGANGQASGFSVTVPSGTLGGSHTLWAVGNTSGRSAQSNSFTVAATATGLSPTSGPVGTAASVVSQGFLPSHALTVTVGGTSASITTGGTTNASGSSTVSFTIPTVANGARTVVVSDGTTSATSASSFSVTASATGLSPASGAVGTTGVSITANGFIASHGLSVQVGGTSASITSGGTTAGNGSATVTFTVPAVPNGPQSVTVSDGTNSATSPTDFTVQASVSVAPSSGTAGTSGVTLTGTGFASGETVSVTFGGSALTLSPATPNVTSAGGWSATFTVPTTTAGAKTIVASDSGGASAQTTFTVTASNHTCTLSTDTGDTYIRQTEAAHGSATTMLTNANGGASHPDNALVQFGILSSTCAEGGTIPANATIVSASLTLTATSATNRTVGVALAGSAWTEGTLTWATATAAEQAPAGSNTRTISSTTVTWTVTSDVQTVVNGSTDGGWVVWDTGTGNSETDFKTKEASSGKPLLVVTYN